MESRLWQLPPTIWVSIGIALTIGIMIYLILKIYIDLTIFSPGVNYRTVIRRFKRSVDRTDDEKKDEKKVRAQEKQKLSEQKFNIASKRLGLKVTYQQNMARKMKVMVPALILWVLAVALGLITLLSSMGKGLVIILLGTAVSGLIVMYQEVHVFWLTRIWKKDVVEDLSNLISFYMHSPERTGIEGAINDSMGDMNALKVDLEMFLADSISYSTEDALDRFADRVGIKEAKEFVNYVKSTERMDKTQSIFMMERLNETFLRYVTRNYEMDTKVKFRLTIGVILIVVVSVIAIYIAPDIAETLSVMSEVEF